MSPPTRTIPCPTKLNLTLAVGPPDRSPAGRGRHPVASLMVALDFGDALEVAFDTSGTRWSRAFTADAPRQVSIDWPLEADLTHRAHAAVEAACGFAVPVNVTLHKRVPPGTGLGAGSADAAAMLHALGTQLAERHPDLQLDLSGIAATLGADVSFALHALQHPQQPAAIATGFGETLEPFTLPQRLHAALILPDFDCPTPAVYAAFDALRPGARPIDEAATRDVVAALQARRTLEQLALFNDLTDAACVAQPKLAVLLEQLREADFAPHVTGSGAAVFLPARHAQHAKQLAAEAARRTGHPCLAVRTLCANRNL